MRKASRTPECDVTVGAFICLQSDLYYNRNPPPPHCRQRAAAGRPGSDSVQGSLHHSEALQPRPSAPVCWRLSRLPGLRPRGGPVSEQRLGRSGCTGEEGGAWWAARSER